MNIIQCTDISELKRTIGSPDPQIIVFAASWCGYCARFLEVSRSYTSKSKRALMIVDVDMEGDRLWDEFRIEIVPTLLVFQKNQEIFRQDGRSGIGLLIGDLERAVNETISAE